MRITCTIGLALLIQFSISVWAIASDSNLSSWQGEWSWDGGADQTGNQWGGSLSIEDCDPIGCAYRLMTGSSRSVCQSEGHFRFSSPTRAIHELDGKDFQDKKSACVVIFQRRDAGLLVIDSEGEGCGYFCGSSGSFGGDFRLWSSVPIYNPSFDCRKAKQPIEKTVCTHKVLADLDRQLSATYSELQAILAPDTKQLRAEQQQWLKKRNQTCGTADITSCLEAAYRQRTVELKKAITDACGLSGNAERCKGVRTQ